MNIPNAKVMYLCLQVVPFTVGQCRHVFAHELKSAGESIPLLRTFNALRQIKHFDVLRKHLFGIACHLLETIPSLRLAKSAHRDESKTSNCLKECVSRAFTRLE